MSDPTTPPPASPDPIPPVTMPYATPGLGTIPADYIEQDPNMRTLAMIAHLLQFAGGFIGPLILYLIKKDDPTTNAYAKDQMKEVLNWQFTLLIGMVISVILIIVIIGIFLYFGLIITALVFAILNSVKANKGVVARYPWSIKFIK